MEKLVEVSEQEVCIDFKLGCKCRTNITLKSLHPYIPVAFKVQTSSPHKFLVNPPNGLISPFSSTTFQVILKPQTHVPPSYPRSPSDRFLIKTILAHDLNPTSPPLDGNSINMLFSSSVHLTHDIKLKVVFGGPFLLHHAVAAGEIDTVKNMIKRHKSIVANLSPQDAMSVLQAASTSGNVSILNLILEAGLRIDADQAQAVTVSNLTVESESESRSKPKSLQLARDDEEAIMESKGWTAIHVAAASDRYDALVKVIGDGRDGRLDCRDKEGRTPLHVATSRGHKRCVRILIEAGVDKNAKSNDGRTALFRAAANGDVEMVRLLLDAGADPSITTTVHGRGPLDVARDKGHKDIVEILEQGELVLTASRRGDVKRLESLLRKGVNIKHCDQYGLTALHTAAIKGYVDIVAKLVEFGMDLETQDAEGHTPLHLAVEGGNVEAVQALIDRGADVNARTKRGATPLYMATSMGYDEISGILLSRGAASSSLPSSSSSLSSSSLN